MKTMESALSKFSPKRENTLQRYLRLQQMFARGLTYEQIGVAEGTNTIQVKNFLCYNRKRYPGIRSDYPRVGLPTFIKNLNKSYKSKYSDCHKIIKSMHEEGLSYRQIAEKLKIPVGSISSIMAKHRNLAKGLTTEGKSRKQFSIQQFSIKPEAIETNRNPS